MNINRLVLLSDAVEDPAMAEPVVIEMQAESSCLLMTAVQGGKKAELFVWRDQEGRTWAKITDAGPLGADNGAEVNLFPEAEKPENEPATPEPEPAEQAPTEEEVIPEGEERVF